MHFWENWLLLWGIWEKLNYFKDLGSKEKYFQRAEEFFFKEFGEINSSFSGVKGAHTSLEASNI